MEQSDEIMIPEIENKPGKKRKLAVWIAAVCIVILAAAAVLIVRVYFNEERALFKGVRNMVEEVQERQELTAQNRPGGVKAETSFNVSVENLPVTLGVDTQILRDVEARKMRTSTDFSIMNMKLAELEIYGEDEMLTVAVPTLWEENFVFSANQIDKQYNESLLAEKWGKIDMDDSIPEISIDLFEEEYSIPWIELVLHCQEIIKELEIERIEEKVAVNIPEKDNKQYRCSQYRVVMPTVEIMGMEWDILDENAILLISVDENERIVQVLLEEPLLLSEGKLTGSISFVGEERRTDDIIVNMQVKQVVDMSQLDEDLLSLFDREGAEQTVEIEMSAESIFDKNDTSVVTNLDELTVSVSYLGTLRVNGTFTILPLQEEIEPPDGENIRIFEITEDEYDALNEERAEKMLRKLEMLMNAVNSF